MQGEQSMITLAETKMAERIPELDQALKKAQGFLLRHQNESGYWAGELEADASVSAGYIPLMYFMNGKVDPAKRDKVIQFCRSQQNGDGSWSTFFGGPGDLNVTIQVYFAFKLAGISASEQYMQKARDFVLSRGGVMKSNTITRVWLAIFGQFDYRGTPSIPPEIVFLPNWFYLNIYEFASWSRETIMALILILSTHPVCQVPPGAAIPELYIEPERKRYYAPAKRDRLFSWKSFFLFGDSLFKVYARFPLKPFHKTAIRKVESWVVDHQETDGSWAGIMLPWVYSLIALKSLGYGPDHPVIKKGLEGLKPFICEDERTFRLQPATSPVWDTAWATLALIETGVPEDHPAVIKSARWLLGKEIRKYGDWKIKNPRTTPGGWSFEFCNDLYPDIDDTAVAARVLLNLQLSSNEEDAKPKAIQRGLTWIKEMQCCDGGWAAFDRDNNKQILMNVPYADFMTPLDPTCADVTAHAMELLSREDVSSVYIKRAIEFLKNKQLADGSWYGRWGVNYIYGTGLTLVGLKSAGEDTGQKYILKAVDWLFSCQQENGSWGETCETYSNPALKGKGPGTPSQTAWALAGLIAADKYSAPEVAKGITYLLQHQTCDGDWHEDDYTGTGFPGAFYLRYDLYRVYFPLLALGKYRTALEAKHG